MLYCFNYSLCTIIEFEVFFLIQIRTKLFVFKQHFQFNYNPLFAQICMVLNIPD